MSTAASKPTTPATAVETVDAKDLSEHADTRGPIRMGFWVLVVGFGLFLLWAALAPLDEGVSAPAVVAIDTKRKAVQHLTGGIVKEVLVHEGARVTEGQLLIKLDDANARANYEGSRQRYLGLRAVQGRLLAEQSGQPTISFHPDLQAASQDPLIRQHMSTQEQLLQARRASLRADLQSIEESIRGQEALVQSYESIVGNRRSQLALLNEELNNTRALVKDGYAPRNRQLELERMVAEVLGRSPGFMLAITGHCRPTELKRQEHQQDDGQPFAHKVNSVAATDLSSSFWRHLRH